MLFLFSCTITVAQHFYAANAVSVYFQSSNEAVTEGHRTVLCVVLNGLPAGGMHEDLTVSLSLANSTAGKHSYHYTVNHS